MAQTFNLGNTTNPRDFNIDKGSLLFANGVNVAYGTTLPTTGSLGQVFFMQNTETSTTNLHFSDTVYFEKAFSSGGRQVVVKNGSTSGKEASIAYYPNGTTSTGVGWTVGTGCFNEKADEFCFYFNGSAFDSTYSEQNAGNKMKIEPTGNVTIHKYRKNKVAGDNKNSIYYYAWSSAIDSSGNNLERIIRFGVGNTGLRAGIYDDWMGGWMIMRDDTTQGNVYSTKGNSIYKFSSSSTSDVRFKKNIENFTKNEKDFYLSLKPKTFQYKENYESDEKEQNKTRYGLMAQDVIQNYEDHGIDFRKRDLISAVKKETFNKKIQDELIDTDEAYFVNYPELHGLHVQMIQDAYKEIEQLKEEIKLLKEKLGE